MRIPAVVGLCACVGVLSVSRADAPTDPLPAAFVPPEPVSPEPASIEPAAPAEPSTNIDPTPLTEPATPIEFSTTIEPVPDAPIELPSDAETTTGVDVVMPAETVQPAETPAVATTPLGADPRWVVNVQTIAAVLNGTLDQSDLRRAIASHAWISPFERNRSESAFNLPARLPTRTVVSIRPYVHPSVSAATDLVADLTANGTIAESIMKQLAAPEGRNLRQADATMARWFASALDAEAGDPVALLAMYEASPTAGMPPQLHLIILRGEVSIADGVPRVTRVLYGTLDAATR